MPCLQIEPLLTTSLWSCWSISESPVSHDHTHCPTSHHITSHTTPHSTYPTHTYTHLNLHPHTLTHILSCFQCQWYLLSSPVLSNDYTTAMQALMTYPHVEQVNHLVMKALHLKSPVRSSCMWWSCDVHVICMWWSCDVHVMLLWCACDVHVTYMYIQVMGVCVCDDYQWACNDAYSQTAAKWICWCAFIGAF